MIRLKLKEFPERVQRHLPFAQGAIAVITGVITIVGAGYSVYRFLNPAPDKGRLEVVIQDNEAGSPLTGVTVEILSTNKALIATLATDQDGRVRYTLKDGRYDVRVRQNGYADATREIQVTPGQDVALTVRLTPPAIKGLQNSFKKVIGRGSSSPKTPQR
jgi:5-hydroxyisourate hydrolase-like protein (transthyretin family)